MLSTSWAHGLCQTQWWVGAQGRQGLGTGPTGWGKGALLSFRTGRGASYASLLSWERGL